MQTRTGAQPGETFDTFARATEPRLLRALIARFGPQLGREATVETLAYGWEHWDRLRGMDNPSGYLFRVGETRAKRLLRSNRPHPLFPEVPDNHEYWVEPMLPRALADLSKRQRTAVILVHCFGWTHREVAEMLDVSPTTVQKHVERAMARLRAALEVEDA